MLLTTSGEIARKLVGGGGQLLDSAYRIASDVLKAIDSSILEVFNDRALSGSPAETLRILSSWSPKTDIDRVVRSMMILSAYRTEQSSPGSSYIFLQLLAGKKIKTSQPRKMVKNDLNILVKEVNDPTIQNLLIDSINQSGAAGNVSVSIGAVTHVSVDESASFPVIVSPSFSNAKSLTIRKIIVYDGVVESVGQINTFLEECSKDSARVLLIAKAFATEVASTIYLNNQNGKFDIVPATPSLSIESEFTIGDIAAITGQTRTDKISFEDSGIECGTIIENGNLKIVLKSDEFRKELLKRLRNEMTQFSNNEILQMLSQRIARISGRRVSVCVGNEFGCTKEIAKEKFDYGMRCYLSARRRGVISLNEKVLPGDALKAATAAYESFTKLLKSSGGALVFDKKVAVAKRKNSRSK